MSKTKKQRNNGSRGGSYVFIIALAELMAVLLTGRIPLYAAFYVKVAVGATVFYITGLIFISILERRQLAGASMKNIDKMAGEEFEQYLGLLYKKAGYKIEYTPGTMDFGADLILTKNGKKIVVQAKRYRRMVGEAAVQQAFSGKGYYGADICLVVTNSTFTNAAKELAEKTGVILIDRWKLGTKAMFP